MVFSVCGVVVFEVLERLEVSLVSFRFVLLVFLIVAVIRFGILALDLSSPMTPESVNADTCTL